MIKKRMVLALALCLALIASLISGCVGTEQNPNAEYTVSFSYNYFTFDEVPARQTVRYGGKVTKPADPVREGYEFLGWFTDEDSTKEWDFGKDTVTGRLVLYAGWAADIRGEIVYPDDDKDFSSLTTPGSQEAAYEYKTFFLPEKDGTRQPYVGDLMPYYEDGVYYFYYLKDGGDSYNHSVYLVTTRDFLTYEEQQEPVLESSRSGSAQDNWIGTGSVVKVNGTYYFFYTGHNGSSTMEYQEKIMVARSDNLTSFEKVAGWEIVPDPDLGQKRDFRDPQAYYDESTGKIVLTVTASKSGVARVIKYTLNADLTGATYDGVIYTNQSGGFFNLECTDTFRIGDKWYLTYSAQDDTLWYAVADNRYGPYQPAKRIDGKLFYAAKHVEDGENSYMVGWGRRSGSPSSTQEVSAWAGNVVVQKISVTESGDLLLEPLDCMEELFVNRRALLVEGTTAKVEAGGEIVYQDVFNCYERFMMQGDFTFSGEGSFGFAFDYNGSAEKYKMIRFRPDRNVVELVFNEGSTAITETALSLGAGRDYSFTYIQEGSVGVLYIRGACSLTVRLYGCSGKPIKLFAENNSVKFTALRQYTD